MLQSQVPARFSIPFGNSAAVGTIRPIHTASQIGIQAGAASLTDGFPPVTQIPVGAGGTPPFGQDFNGLFNQVTAVCRWTQAGNATFFDAGFSGSVGGYPKGAVLGSASIAGHLWVSTADNNNTNPDAGGTNWFDNAAPIARTYTRLTTTGSGAYLTPAGVVRIRVRGVGSGGGGASTGGSAGSGASCTFGGWVALGGGGGQNSTTIPAGGGQITPGTNGSGVLIMRVPGASGNLAHAAFTGFSGLAIISGAPGASGPWGGAGPANGPAVGFGSGGGSVDPNNASDTSGAAGEYMEFEINNPAASIPYNIGPGGVGQGGGGLGKNGVFFIEELYQ